MQRSRWATRAWWEGEGTCIASAQVGEACDAPDGLLVNADTCATGLVCTQGLCECFGTDAACE